MTNLEKLFVETRKIDNKIERECFDDYFIGALSQFVDDKDWNAAIESAKRLLERRRNNKAVQS